MQRYCRRAIALCIVFFHFVFANPAFCCQICQKVFVKKRKAFDSTKARVTGGKVDPEQAKFCSDKRTADKKIAQGRRDSQEVVPLKTKASTCSVELKQVPSNTPHVPQGTVADDAALVRSW